MTGPPLGGPSHFRRAARLRHGTFAATAYINGMARDVRTTIRKRVRTALTAGLFAAAFPATLAGAVDISVPIIAGPVVNQGDLQALQDRLSRQQFQQQQQQDRQQERNAVPVLRPRENVPRMKPGCQLPINGSIPSDCR